MRYLLAALALTLSACTAPEAASQGCEGTAAHLMSYAGSYDTDAFLNEPEVSAAIARLMGGERDHLLANVAVRGSIDLVGCELVISGNAEHQGGEEDGVVSFSLGAGTASAALRSGGAFHVYTQDGSYDSAPISVKDWIAVAASGYEMRFGAPAGTRLHGPSGR